MDLEVKNNDILTSTEMASYDDDMSRLYFEVKKCAAKIRERPKQNPVKGMEEPTQQGVPLGVSLEQPGVPSSVPIDVLGGITLKQPGMQVMQKEHKPMNGGAEVDDDVSGIESVVTSDTTDVGSLLEELRGQMVSSERVTLTDERALHSTNIWQPLLKVAGHKESFEERNDFEDDEPHTEIVHSVSEKTQLRSERDGKGIDPFLEIQNDKAADKCSTAKIDVDTVKIPTLDFSPV